MTTAQTYSLTRIADELDATANGHAYYGNALRVAKDVPGVTAEDRSCLDRYADGSYVSADRFTLLDLAIRLRDAAASGGQVAAPAVETSPLPWALYFDHPDHSLRKEIGVIAPATDSGKRAALDICNVFCCAIDPRQKANAQLIVRAVNSHHALLTELSEVLNWLKEVSRLNSDHDIDIPMETVPFIRAIEKAIAKAKV